MPNHTKLEFDTLTSLRISYIIIIIIQILVRQTKIENFTIKNLNTFFIFLNKFIFILLVNTVFYIFKI